MVRSVMVESTPECKGGISPTGVETPGCVLSSCCPSFAPTTAGCDSSGFETGSPSLLGSCRFIRSSGPFACNWPRNVPKEYRQTQLHQNNPTNDRPHGKRKEKKKESDFVAQCAAATLASFQCTVRLSSRCDLRPRLCAMTRRCASTSAFALARSSS